MRLPELRSWDIGDAPPEIRIGQVFLPIAQILFVERGKLGGHPRFGMNAVRDAGDRNLVAGNAGPDIFPETAADFPVEFADAVRVPAHPEREHGHAERVDRIDAGLAEPENLVEGNTELIGEIAEVS